MAELLTGDRVARLGELRLGCSAAIFDDSPAGAADAARRQRPLVSAERGYGSGRERHGDDRSRGAGGDRPGRGGRRARRRLFLAPRACPVPGRQSVSDCVAVLRGAGPRRTAAHDRRGHIRRISRDRRPTRWTSWPTTSSESTTRSTTSSPRSSASSPPVTDQMKCGLSIMSASIAGAE